MISTFFPRYKCTECHEIKDSYSEMEEHLMRHNRTVYVSGISYRRIVPDEYRYVKKYIYILMNGKSEITSVLVPSRPRNRING